MKHKAAFDTKKIYLYWLKNAISLVDPQIYWAYLDFQILSSKPWW